MLKTFVTFGQIHTHSVNGKTLDKDTVAVIKHKLPEEGRELAFELFGPSSALSILKVNGILTICSTSPKAMWRLTNA